MVIYGLNSTDRATDQASCSQAPQESTTWPGDAVACKDGFFEHFAQQPLCCFA